MYSPGDKVRLVKWHTPVNVTEGSSVLKFHLGMIFTVRRSYLNYNSAFSTWVGPAILTEELGTSWFIPTECVEPFLIDVHDCINVIEQSIKKVKGL